MGRPIDADKLKQRYAWWGECSVDELKYYKDAFDNFIDSQPTVKPKHGDWLYEEGTGFYCSKCKEPSEQLDYRGLTRFCPHCGAKMGGKVKNNERKCNI